MDKLPAGAAFVALSAEIAADPVADAVVAAELLDVDMDEFARPLALIADDPWLGIEGRETSQAAAAQDEADR